MNPRFELHSVIYNAIEELKQGLVYLKNRIVQLDQNQVSIQNELGLIQEQFNKLTTSYNSQYNEITEDLNALEEKNQQPSEWQSHWSYVEGSRVLYGTDTFQATDFVGVNQTPPPENSRWTLVFNN